MLILNEATWKQLLTLLATSPDGVERVAYLDGVRDATHPGADRDADPTDAGLGVVTTITVPRAVQSAGHFAVSASEMSRAGTHLRQHGLVRLAQVHTHPGRDTRHSHIDDESAYSRKPGAISIVLPWHAAGDPVPADGSVHLRDGSSWRRLSHADAHKLIRIIPAVIDTRPDNAAHQPDSSSPVRRKRWWSWSTISAHVTRPR